MTRIELEKHLGKKVKVTLFDGTVINGFLHKTGEKCFENIPELYIPKNQYVCTYNRGFYPVIFKVSHIRGLKEIS